MTAMGPRTRVFLLIGIMACTALVVEVITISMLYRTALKEEQARLVETAKSQARLIEAIARFDAMYSKNYPHGAREASLSQILDAHNHYKHSSKTGEFVLATREGNNIVFLLSHRHHDFQNPKPTPLDSKWAEPMRLALSGRSGTMIGLDYRGEKVLAAYEPVAELDLGIVAKVDLAEIRAPFVKAGWLSGIFGTFAVLVGAAIFIKVTNPLLEKLHETIEELKASLSKVRILSGLLPICASCKKIRDDKGYWNQIESYISDHSEAEFSHGICPDCFKKLYPGFRKKRGTETTSSS
jgi:hypothetical protein